MVKKLLIVDDTADSLKALQVQLRKFPENLEILTAINGFEAIEKAESFLPDTIILDVNMPGINGYEVFKRIRDKKNIPYIPIIFLTAFETDIDSRTKGYTLGADDYIEKPIQTKELYARLNSVLKIKSLQDELYNEKKMLEKKVEESTKELRNHSVHLQKIREEERKNIALTIHDELGQILTALKMDLFWMIKKFTKNQKLLLDKAYSMIELVDNAIKTVQKISSELRPQVLDDLGLLAALEWLVNEFKKHSGIKYEINYLTESINMKQDRAIAVFRIFQEILTNISRHAEATLVRVNIENKNNLLKFSISDNGKGIKKEDINSPNSLGIIGIKERIKYLNGDFNIDSFPKKGTIYNINIPIIQKKPSRKENK